jgi:hypothetical protein
MGSSFSSNIVCGASLETVFWSVLDQIGLQQGAKHIAAGKGGSGDKRQDASCGMNPCTMRAPWQLPDAI